MLTEVLPSSVWKPLRGPVRDWPLALCDMRTVDPEADFEPADLVYAQYVVENRQVYHAERQRWYYLSNQQPDEAWVFVQSDSHGGGIGTSRVCVGTLREETLKLSRCCALCVPASGDGGRGCSQGECGGQGAGVSCRGRN
jgi:hypothetical protein